MEGPATGEPPRGQQGSVRSPRLAKGEDHSHRNCSRRRHTARGAKTSGGGEQVTGAGNVQVSGASRRERRWVEGKNERGL